MLAWLWIPKINMFCTILGPFDSSTFTSNCPWQCTRQHCTIHLPWQHLADPTCEIELRINLASAAFIRILRRVLFDTISPCSPKWSLKCLMFISTLLYSCECWVSYHRQIQATESFQFAVFKESLGFASGTEFPTWTIGHLPQSS